MNKSFSKRWVGHVERMGRTGFRWGNPRERDHLEDLGVDRAIIIIIIIWGMNWINLIQNRDRWWDVVNMVMNFRVL